MTTWVSEPGHTEVGFHARHMMVTWVRGLFKDIHGRLEFYWDHCLESDGSEAVKQDHLPGDGVVVSDEIDLVLDIEAIHEGDLEKTGVIAYYRDQE
jgi:hypothetical protein